MRRGFSLLWEPRVLTELVAPAEVLSMHEFFLVRKSWPCVLPLAVSEDEGPHIIRRPAHQFLEARPLFES
jgi:hypothetical protein